MATYKSAGGFKLGINKKTTVSGQSRTGTRNLRVTGPAPASLDHAVSQRSSEYNKITTGNGEFLALNSLVH